MRKKLFYRLKTSLLLGATLLILGCANQGAMNNDVTDSAWQQRNSVEQVEQQLLGYFNDWKGTPYRYGGNGRSGIDCSAFVKNAYQSVFKVDVPRTTWLQASLGYQVDRAELLPGDLVLFKTSRSVRHIGVVVNGNHFMHVSETHGVMISTLDNIYWRKKYWKAVRPENGITI